MAQVISLVQEKGGAGKSTLLAVLASLMNDDGLNVIIVDTDPQQTIAKWADKDGSNIDFLTELDDTRLTPTLNQLKETYDVIFIDTAGYSSVMTMYAISEADLVLIPSKASEPDAQGALKTYQHVKNLSDKQKHPIKAYIVMNDVDKTARITDDVRKAFDDNKIPRLNAILWSRTGLKEMISEGGAPKGNALSAAREVMAELQILNAINTKKRV